MFEYEKISFKDVVHALLIAVFFVSITVLANGCASTNSECLDGYLYDKNEYGYKLKIENDKKVNC